MRTLSKLVPLALFGAAVAIQACGSIKLEDSDYDKGGRRFPVKGVIRGSVIYQGPIPCSANGHMIGSAILLVFDRRNPPPPAGLANTAANFVAVSGDVLFADQSREPGPVKYCPVEHGNTQIVTVSAPYAIAPMDPGSYYIQAFYDEVGDFLPTFKFRNLPVAGDVGGGYIDTNDPNQLEDDPSKSIPLADGGRIHPQIPKSSDANYQPVYLNVDVGVPGAVPANSLRGVPEFTMPDDGFVADNVTVSIGAALPLSRPYFYLSEATAAKAAAQAVLNGVDGAPSPIPPADSRWDLTPASADKPASADSVKLTTPSNPGGDRNYAPVVTMAQDYQVPAQPKGSGINLVNVTAYQALFPQVQINYGVPQAEQAAAIDPANPFHMQLKPPSGNGGIFVWWDGTHPKGADNFIPEGTVPKLWPLVVFAKLKDRLPGDNTNAQHTDDPESLVAQGADLKEPVVIIQGITIGGQPTGPNPDASQQDLLLPTITPFTPPIKPNAGSLRDHVTVLIRPSVLCIDPRHVDRGGLLVTPHTQGQYPPTIKSDRAQHPLFDPALVLGSQPQLIAGFREACLPPGRYGVNVVYPTGQAWTVPNEIGSCAPKEGTSDTSVDPSTCSAQTRPVLYSQGNRNVIEVVPSSDPTFCTGAHAVPNDCLQLSGE